MKQQLHPLFLGSSDDSWAGIMSCAERSRHPFRYAKSIKRTSHDLDQPNAVCGSSSETNPMKQRKAGDMSPEMLQASRRLLHIIPGDNAASLPFSFGPPIKHVAFDLSNLHPLLPRRVSQICRTPSAAQWFASPHPIKDSSLEHHAPRRL